MRALPIWAEICKELLTLAIGAHSVGRRNACHSVSESAESPASFRSLRASAESDANLALALEAQVELASLREEHRHLITVSLWTSLQLGPCLKLARLRNGTLTMPSKSLIVLVSNVHK